MPPSNPARINSAENQQLLPQSGQNTTLQSVHIFSPSLLNELRFGYNRAIHYTKELL